MPDLSPASEEIVQAAYDALPEMAGERALDRVAVAIVQALARHRAAPWEPERGPLDHWRPSIWARRELEVIASEVEAWSLGDP